MENRNETADQPGVVAKARDELRAMMGDKRVTMLIKAIAEETALGKNSCCNVTLTVMMASV